MKLVLHVNPFFDGERVSSLLKSQSSIAIKTIALFGIRKHQFPINKAFIKNKTVAVTIPAPIRFRTIPARDIFGILTQPLPKTIAFGGVATGNIKANEAAKVAGTIKNNG
jgi:hypothetical protein